MKDLRNQEYLGIDENGFEHRGFVKNSLDEIKKKIFWETNSAVKRNSNIDAKQIIPKSPTHDFPEGTTVRTYRMKDGATSAYFHGEVTQNIFFFISSNEFFTNPLCSKPFSSIPKYSWFLKSFISNWFTIF